MEEDEAGSAGSRLRFGEEYAAEERVAGRIV
jgi:hypothetical protein